MNLNLTARKLLLLCGAALLTVVGMIAWTHQGTPVNTASYGPATVSGDPEPVSRDYPDPEASGVATSTAAPSESNLGPTPPPSPGEARLSVATRVAPRRAHATVSYRKARHHQVIMRKRSLKHSLAIVGGSAAGGAILGAVAGGGKGAGIGALVGGAGGFIYDRLTHKKRVVVTE